MADLFEVKKIDRSHVGGVGVGQMKFEAYDDAGLVGGASNGILERNRNDVLNLKPEEVSIQFDEHVYSFSEDILPGALGKKLRFSTQNGNMWFQYASQKGDVAGKCPAGNHDLLYKGELQLATGFKRPFVASFPTIRSIADEHYFGNSSSGVGNNCVSYLFTPVDFSEGKASVVFVQRRITQSMKSFLEQYPNQTADTLESMTTHMKSGSEVMIKYDENDTTRSSAVSMWYHSMVLGIREDGSQIRHRPLQAMANGHASMPKDIYTQCLDKAKEEISRYISLADVTSEDFCMEISDPEGRGLGAFEAQYKGVDPNQLVMDPATGEMISAKELHARTPIHFAGRLVLFYKKIHTGDN